MGTLTTKPASLSAKRAALLSRLLDAEQPEPDRRIPPRKNPREYPLSPGQQRMWLLGQFEKGTHYNEDCNFRLKGTVNVPVLKNVLREIFRRHEAMRAIFALEEGKVVQQLVPVEALNLPVIDISDVPEPRREAEALRLALEEAHKEFDLSKGPLWRFSLVVLDEQNSILLTTAHHIAVDGWSRDIFRKEFFTLYEAFLAGKPSPLPEPVIQYADYGTWLTNWLEGVEANQQRAYWTRQLTGAPQLLELPADRPRQANQSFRGKRFYCTIPKQLITTLKTISNREGVTFFMALLALFNTLIKRYTEKDDIVIGSPVANRTHPEIEGLIGFFVNTIALRTDLSGDPTFRELLHRVRETTIGGVSNQGLPFDQLVELLHPERTEAYSPLVQVLLVFRNPSGTTAELENLSVSEFKIDNGTSKFDLSLYLAEGPDGLSCMYEYSTDLFNTDRIERMAGHLHALMESVALDPGKRLSELSILTTEERKELVVNWNETAVQYPKEVSLAQLVEAQARRTPEAAAVVHGKQKLTYRELNARANQLAHKLCAHGAGPDKVVGLYVERSTDLVVALLAIVKTGAGYLPLDPLFPADRLSYMLADSGAQLLVTGQKLRGTLPTYAGTTILLEDKDWRADSTENVSAEVTPEHLAYLIYTSGSTGKPKGVQVSRGALTNFLWSMREWLALSERDRLLAVTTISFDIAGLEIWLPLLVGAQIVVASHEAAADGNALRGLIEGHDITFLQATPVTWRLLFEAGWKGKRDLQAVCGGEAMPSEVASQLVPAVNRVWNLYGPTETTIWSTGYLLTDASKPILIGRPLGNTQCYILDAQRNPVPVGVTGELYIGGDGLARGYLNRPELTAEKFVADTFRGGETRMYRTGDLARYRADGNIECLGRVDHQVKLRGYRIELGEIEALLKATPEIKQAVVLVREDKPGDKRLVAYYSTGLEGGPDQETIRAEALRAHLSASLPEYMVPAAFVRMETFPLTPNGKLDRKALPAPEAEAFSTQAYEPPQGELETKLAAVWAEMLNVDRIGRHDNFFDLGGHSLLAVRLMVRLQQIIPGEVLPVRSILEAPTVERFAVWLGDQKSAEQQVLVRLRQGNPARTPFFCAHASDGIAIGMRPLAMAMDPDVPFYCLQAKGLDGSEPFATVEEAAHYCLDEIRKVQPHGPYNLGGYCYGGVIVFEMARLLEQAGEDVASLVFIDAYNPAYRASLTKSTMLLRLMKFHLRRVAVHARKLASLKPAEWLEYVVSHARSFWFYAKYYLQKEAADRNDKAAEKTNLASTAGGSDLEAILKRLRYAGPNASNKFKPMPYDGNALVIRVNDRNHDPFEDRFLGWKPVVRGKVESVEIDANHDSILHEPAVRSVAEQINAHLPKPPAETGEEPISNSPFRRPILAHLDAAENC